MSENRVKFHDVEGREYFWGIASKKVYNARGQELSFTAKGVQDARAKVEARRARFANREV